MKKYVLDLNIERCIACGACVVACMDQNDLEPEYAHELFRKTAILETGHGMSAEFVYISMACMHCSNAPCIRACPCGCLKKDPDTGLTVYDNTNCIGCRSCSMACPFSAPTFNREGKMVKCDGCNTRIKNGLEPACVRVCPFDALTFAEEAEAARDRMSNSLAAIACVIRKESKGGQ
jgi:anaerobic dimethyl sulfoxide reductase subunit B (iron-sulfur subunit)